MVACSGRGTAWPAPPPLTGDMYYLVLRPDGTYGTNLPFSFGLDYLDLANLDKGDGPSFVFLPYDPQPHAWLRLAVSGLRPRPQTSFVFGAERVILAGVSAETHGPTQLELDCGSCRTALTLPAPGGDVEAAPGPCADVSSVDTLNAALRYSDFNSTTGWLGVRQIAFVLYSKFPGSNYPAPALPAARRGHFTLRQAR